MSVLKEKKYAEVSEEKMFLKDEFQVCLGKKLKVHLHPFFRAINQIQWFVSADEHLSVWGNYQPSTDQPNKVSKWFFSLNTFSKAENKLWCWKWCVFVIWPDHLYNKLSGVIHISQESSEVFLMCFTLSGSDVIFILLVS